MRTSKSKSAFSEAGFSMVEMVIYIAILSMLTGVVFEMISNVIHSEGRLETASALSSSAMSALQRIEFEIRAAHDASISGPSQLILNKTDENNQEHTLEFFLTDGRLHVSDNGLDLGPLTAGEVTVSSLNFSLLTASTGRAVKIDLGLNEKIFHLTVALRPK